MAAYWLQYYNNGSEVTMCGIYGFVTDKRHYDVKGRLFHELALATQIRGTHATGWAYTDGAHARYFKAGCAAEDVDPRVYDELTDAMPYMVIGHDRFATHGLPSDNINNHPFKSRALQFAHNGVISNYDALKAEYQCWSECDSEVILRIIEQADRRIKGIQDVYKLVHGSFACSMMDERKLRVWLWRNHGNPIWAAYHADLNIFAWASTSGIFKDACKAAGIPEGWQGRYLDDENILIINYRPDDGKILRTLVEVEHKQISPYVVQGWTAGQLTRYAKYYSKRNAERKGPAPYDRGRESTRERRGRWSSEDHCWIITREG